MLRVFCCPVSEQSIYARLLFQPLADRYKPVFVEQVAPPHNSGPHAPQAPLWQAIAHLAAGAPVLLHVQWEEFFLNSANNEAEADAAATLAVARLQRHRELGGKLVWTVHNGLPHRIPYHAAFLTIRRCLAECADVILVHNHTSIAVLQHQVRLDLTRVRLLPHPSYLGWYEAEGAAAAAISLAPERCVLGFGTIRAQKGFGRMLDMLPAEFLATQQAQIRISGRGGHEARTLQAQHAGRTDILWDIRQVPDAEVPGLIRRSACVVLSYERFLTSGVALLVLSCGGLLVAPDMPQFRELLPAELHRFLYRPGDAADLQRVVAEVLALDTEARLASRQAALAVAEALHPRRIAADLGTIYDELARQLPELKVAKARPGLQPVTSPADAELTQLPPVVCDWPRSGPVGRNWGDKLNPQLIRLLSGRAALHADFRIDEPELAIHRVIGSGIAHSTAQYVIWGSGFIHSRDTIPELRAIHAVRGPLTRARLLAAGRDCPEVYGDPALLLPLFYRPDIVPRYDLGIIQHFREAGVEPLPQVPDGLRVKIIDITGSVTQVIDDILACREIVSSSLHGLIAAHAYGVPASWIKFSERPVGDGFKFLDYWASMGWPDARPIPVDAATCCSVLLGEKQQRTALVDPALLLAACPFLHPARRVALLQRAAEVLPGLPPVQFLAAAATVSAVPGPGPDMAAAAP